METENTPVNRRRILIAGYMGFGNAGDEAILASMIESFRALPSCPDVTVVSGDPAGTFREYGVSAVPWQDPLAIAEAARASDLVILGGGGLFHDYWGFDPDLLLTPKQWGLSYFAAPAILAALYRKPLMLYAVGVGPLLSEHGRSFTKIVCDVAACITVRDEGSRKALQALGVPATRITVTADPAFALEAGGMPLSREPRDREFLVGVVLRIWNIGVDEAFWERQVAKALDMLLDEEAGRAVFLPFQRTSGEDDDLAPLRRVSGQMRHGDRVEIRTDPQSVPEIAAVLGRCRIVVAMRLHALILSAMAGVPFVGLGYDPKVMLISDELGFGELTLPLGGIDAPRLADLLRQVLSKHAQISEHLRNVSAEMRIRARQTVRLAADLVETHPSLPEVPPAVLDLTARAMDSQMRFAADAAAEHKARETALNAEIGNLRSQAAELDSLRAEVAATGLELQARTAEAEHLRAEVDRLQQQVDRLAHADVRVRHLCHELELAWNERWTANRPRANSDTHSAYARFLEARLADLERKSWRAVAKRGLQVLLDLLQLSTPEFLRAVLRRYYLEYFYFKIYPERRPNPAASPSAQATAEPAANSVVVYSGYAPFIEFKHRLARNLPMDFSSLGCGKESLVSIVLPVYNGQRYIRESIESVLAQSYANLELILVDDGSTDQTPEILESYTRDSRVRVIHQPNQKLPMALTNGFAAARGEFYTWTSDDNIMLPNQLSELVAFLREHPSVEFVYADEEIIDDDGRPVENSDFCPGYQMPAGSNVICWPRDTGELNFVQNNYIGGCFLYRAWAGRIVGGYDPGSFGFEDYDYWMRMNALFRMSHLGIRKPLYRYRLHGDSLSAREKQLRIIDRVRDFMATETARRQFFAENFDITFMGRHPWFQELGDLYKEYGNNVFQLVELNDTGRYHHEVTRAFSKSVTVCSSALSALELERVLAWSRHVRTMLVLFVDNESGPGAAGSVFNAFDWVVATTPAAWQGIREQHPQKTLSAQSAPAVAYPLLAMANAHGYANRSMNAR